MFPHYPDLGQRWRAVDRCFLVSVPIVTTKWLLSLTKETMSEIPSEKNHRWPFSGNGQERAALLCFIPFWSNIIRYIHTVGRYTRSPPATARPLDLRFFFFGKNTACHVEQQLRIKYYVRKQRTATKLNLQIALVILRNSSERRNSKRRYFR